MSEIKNIIGIIAIILIFLGYIPYFRDLIKGKTVPHIYSWILWGFVTFIVAALQFSDGAGIGALITLVVAGICAAVIIVSVVKHKGSMNITLLDKAFLILGFISLGIWLLAKQPLLSAVLATTTDLLAFAPTIRKSWHKPYSETLSLYELNVVRFSLALVALQHYSLITVLYPASWVVGNGLFAVVLILRRKKLI